MEQCRRMDLQIAPEAAIASSMSSRETSSSHLPSRTAATCASAESASADGLPPVSPYCLSQVEQKCFYFSLKDEGRHCLSFTLTGSPADRMLPTLRVTKPSASYRPHHWGLSRTKRINAAARKLLLPHLSSDNFMLIWWFRVSVVTSACCRNTSDSNRAWHLSIVTIWNRGGNSESNPQRGSSSTSTTISSRPSGRTACLTASAVLSSPPAHRPLRRLPPPAHRSILPAGRLNCSVLI